MRLIPFAALAPIAGVVFASSSSGEGPPSPDVLALTSQQYQAKYGLQPLSATELGALLVGNSIKGVSEGGNYVTYFSKSGEMRGSWSKGNDNASDEGTWKILDAGLWCHAWSEWLDGKEKCYRIYPGPDGTFGNAGMWFTPDGRSAPSNAETAEIVQGNIAGL